MREMLVDRIAKLLEHQLGVAVPSVDVDLFDSGAVDSLSFVNLLMLIESEFGLFIALESLDFSDFKSVRTIAAYINRETAGRVVDIKVESG